MAGRTGIARAGLATAVSWAVAAGLTAAALDTLHAETGARPLTVDDLVAAAVLAVGAVAAVVLAVGCSLLLVAAGVESTGRAARRLHDVASWLTPTVVRRCVGVTVGAGLGLGVGLPAASAADVEIGWQPTGPVASTTSSDAPRPTTERDASTPADPVADVGPAVPVDRAVPSPTRGDDADDAAGSRTYTVRAGDSLWAIAADHLPDDASDDDVAAAWPRWYAANRDAVGPDPDLIHPGQTLRVPSTVPTEERA